MDDGEGGNLMGKGMDDELVISLVDSVMQHIPSDSGVYIVGQGNLWSQVCKGVMWLLGGNHSAEVVGGELQGNLQVTWGPDDQKPQVQAV